MAWSLYSRLRAALAPAVLLCLGAAGGCSSSEDDAPLRTGETTEKAPPRSTLEHDAGDAPIDAGSSTLSGPVDALLPGLPHVVSVVEKYSSTDGGRILVPKGYRRFDIEFDQPTDHAHPEGEHFRQRVSLLHADASKPMVLASTGYELGTGRSELTTGFETNQIQVEHRYFARSTPASKNLAHLTIAQSAADFHEIVQSFRRIYGARWINTGASKGGETAVFLRRFYPNDVYATVAYVAPLVLGQADARFPAFLSNVGGDELAPCRARITAYQRAILARRREITALFSTLPTPDLERRLESFVVDYPHGFFQYYDPIDPFLGCGSIPAPDAPARTLLDHLQDVAGYELDYATAQSNGFDAYVVQAELELGNYANFLAPVSSTLRYPELFEVRPTLDPTLMLTFRTDAMPSIQRWVSTEGERLLFMYGEWDPWTAAAYQLGAAKDSSLHVVQKANHGAGIDGLVPAERQRVVERLERWFDIKRPASFVGVEPSRVFTDETRSRRRNFQHRLTPH